MPTNLMNIFNNNDLKAYGKTACDVISLAFKFNKKTGERIARAVLNDGTTLIKSVTSSGIATETVKQIPDITSTPQRNAVIKDLANQKLTQEAIAAMLDISQATVSKVLSKR